MRFWEYRSNFPQIAGIFVRDSENLAVSPDCPSKTDRPLSLVSGPSIPGAAIEKLTVGH
jgi:hypothetical protein